MLYDWSLWARPNQLPPAWNWYVWLLLSGRGGGKTRSGAEQVIKWAKEGESPIALLGRTKADVRDIMVETGESSIIQCSPPWFMPKHEPTKRRLVWPNGVLGIMYSADEPDQLRGPEHKKAWADEVAKYERPQEAWDNLMFGLRKGLNPQVIVTTTPRPIALIKSLVKDPLTAVVRSHTLENKDNLAPSFLRYIIDRYEGTRLGRQELAGEILDDNPDALWNRDRIDELRVKQSPELFAIVVAIDPEAKNNPNSAETGIIVVGLGYYAGKIHAYVLADLSIKADPHTWASRAVNDGYKHYKADMIVGEVNNGGDMVEYTVKTIDELVPFTQVHATRGKYSRAEPVSSLYKQGLVHHVGFFPELEDQMCEWVPGEKSPDRMDALVWAITYLMLNEDEEEQHTTVVYHDPVHISVV